MAEYLNRATKEIVVCLAGCVGFADKLLEVGNFRGMEKAQAHLQNMMDEAGAAMEAIMEGIDQQQVKALLRYTNACQSTLDSFVIGFCEQGDCPYKG